MDGRRQGPPPPIRRDHPKQVRRLLLRLFNQLIADPKDGFKII